MVMFTNRVLKTGGSHMFHKVYWGDIDSELIKQDEYNPEWLLFAVWESPVDKTTQMYFVTDPILVFDLAYKNKEESMAKSMIGQPYSGQQILNMIHYYKPQNRIYAVGKRIS